jgi:hypothetical protein
MFHGALVREQAVKRAMEPILVDLLFAELQQIAKRRAAILPLLLLCGTEARANSIAEPIAVRAANEERNC